MVSHRVERGQAGRLALLQRLRREHRMSLLFIADDLGKTIDVYALAQYQHASKTDSTGPRTVAQTDGLSASSGADQWVARMVIRHRS